MTTATLIVVTCNYCHNHHHSHSQLRFKLVIPLVIHSTFFLLAPKIKVVHWIVVLLLSAHRQTVHKALMVVS